jgi:N-acetylglucosamine kinase-like BadF-type ATPase
VRFPSLGQLTGDWGGGAHLGSLALWHAARAEDGRGPVTGLVGAITEHFGLHTIPEVSAAMHLGTLHHDRLNELAPLVFRAAAGGDPVARELVVAQGVEIVTMATVALRRLRLLTSPVAVVFGGGVLRSRDPVLFGVITERLHTAAPRAAITLVTDPPVLGAALLALDMLGIDGPAHGRLRAEVAQLAG